MMVSCASQSRIQLAGYPQCALARCARSVSASASSAAARRISMGMVWCRGSMRISTVETWVVSLLLAADVLAFSTALTVQFTLPKLLALAAGTALLATLWALRAREGTIRPLPAAVALTAALLAAWWIVSALVAFDRTTALEGAPGR